MGLLVPIGRVTTARTRLPRVVATVQDALGLRQVCERWNTFGRVGAIRTWTEHRVALLAQRLGPELYDKGLLGTTRYPRYSLEKTSWVVPARYGPVIPMHAGETLSWRVVPAQE